MTIENLNQIAIKYATTKGSRVPLAPYELCNAVVQYMNSFYGVMTDINTIKVAVTEDSGNIVFTITGNTYDGKPITPIVITVDHNDFVSDQEFEAFKTTTNAAIQKNTESINSLSFRVEDTENDITTIQVQVGQINIRVGNTETDVTNLKNRVNNTETNIAEINSTLYNKLDKNTSETQFSQVYIKLANGDQEFVDINPGTSAYSIPQRSNIGRIYAEKGAAGDPSSVANMSNIADVEAKIPDVSNFATKDEIPDVSGFATKSELSEKLDISGGTINGKLTVEGTINTSSYLLRGSKVIDLDVSNSKFDVGNAAYGINILSSNRPTVKIGENTANIAFENDIPEYTSVDSVIYDTTNGAIIAYSGANEIHIPLLAGENVTIDVSEDNKKIVISAAGGGGTGDVTAAGNNTFTGENTFTNEITFNTMKSEAGYIQFGNFNYETTEGYDYLYIDNNHINIQKFVGNNRYHEININANLMTYAPPDDNVYYEYSYPRKSGTFALTSDIPDTSSFVALADDNTFSGTNTFNNSIYAKNGVVAGDTTNYGANSVTKGSNTYSFPNKSGTFAMTTDVIKNPIYFISFYANELSNPCHLIGTMMSKNSYGTGQKTNEEFAVMLADNLYTNSNEGLAVYGKLAEKDILCIYSEDGLSIRCLNEENSEVDLSTVMFFIMETEL